MSRDLFDYIKSKFDCISYAQNSLGLPLHKQSDGSYRTVPAFLPNAANHSRMIISPDGSHWHDFATDLGGDVITLCAVAHHNGNISLALRELAPERISHDFSPDKWQNDFYKLQRDIDFWHSSLRPADFDYLNSRRISQDTISRLKIGFSSNMNRIIVPYFRNSHVVYWAGRTLAPVVKGQNPKYLKAKLENNSALENCPWGLHTFSSSFNVRKGFENIAVISEGLFDILSCEQEGFRSLSPIGGFFPKYQLLEVFSLCRNLDFVFVCNDSDGSGQNFNVKICSELFKQDIPFRVGCLPEGIKDISDYYAAGGDISQLISQSQDGFAYLAPRITDKDEFAQFVKDSAKKVDTHVLVDMCSNAQQFDPKFLGALVHDAKKMPPEKKIIEALTKSHNIIFSEGAGFFEYKSGVWSPISDNIIRRYLSDTLGNFATGSRLSSLTVHMKARLSVDEEFNTQHIFNFRNGILDLNGNGKLLPHAPEYMSSVQVDYDYEPHASSQNWEQFMYDVLGDDQKKLDLAQELAGYILFSDNSLQKCFFLMGDGGNGKSVFIDVLKGVFGEKNCSNVDVSRFGNEFEPIRLRNSVVNFCAETRANLKDAESRFKAIVTGDTISAAKKGRDAVEFRPRCKIIMAANNYVATNDISHGFLRRIKFLKFTRTFEGKQADTGLTSRLLKDRAGIFNWVYAGYKRLVDRKEFTNTQEHESVMKEFMQSINPVAAFISEECPESMSGDFTAKELYTQYTQWAKEAGNSPLNRINFTRTFTKLIAQTGRVVRVKTVHGMKVFEFGV